MFTVTHTGESIMHGGLRNVTVTFVTVTSDAAAHGGPPEEPCVPRSEARRGIVLASHQHTCVHTPVRAHLSRRDRMADFMRDLPLSWHDQPDESDVTSDWRGAASDVIGRAAALLETADVGEATREWLATDFTLAMRSRRFGFATEPDQPDGSPAGMRELARETRTGRTTSVRLLARAVAAYLGLARELGAAADLPPRTSGAVALYLAAKAPTPIRAVISGHTLSARDAGWAFGRGPMLEDDAVPLIEFLLGRSDRAPTRPPPATGA
jgi:hypothetical protein